MRWFIEKNGEPQLTTKEEHSSQYSMLSKKVDSNRLVDHGKSYETIIVSTCFMGYDFESGKVFLPYETLVLYGNLDGHICKYSTRAAARAGHKEIVEIVIQSIQQRKNDGRIPS